MPLKKLIPLCKEFGILTIIDGTHAPGQIPLDLRTLDADFYTGKTICCGYSINKKKIDKRTILMKAIQHKTLHNLYSKDSDLEWVNVRCIPDEDIISS
jgi:Cys-tRNA synthase (O-phospho-L-seryl-tRNA:Cys-tRNA synthase)